jgi:hypothetical protein
VIAGQGEHGFGECAAAGFTLLRHSLDTPPRGKKYATRDAVTWLCGIPPPSL